MAKLRLFFPLVLAFISSCESDDVLQVSGIEYGMLACEEQIYRTVEIGNQIWMAENLNYNAVGSVCYDNLESNCEQYGRLYEWETALTACPLGWHLPSDAEWTVLANFLGGSSKAGTKLKAKAGWNNNGNGTDNYGFSALPGGYGYGKAYGSPYGDFYYISSNGYWWSATESSDLGAWTRDLGYRHGVLNRYEYDKTGRLSVRCVQDF